MLSRFANVARVGSRSMRRGVFQLNPVKTSIRCQSSHPGIIESKSDHSISMNVVDPRCSVLCEVPDKPGALFVLLSFFWKHEVQLTAIESRPVTGSADSMTIQMSFAGSRDDPTVEKLTRDLAKKCKSILVLDQKVVS